MTPPDFDVTEEMYQAGRIAGLREAADKCEQYSYNAMAAHPPSQEASAATLNLALFLRAAADKLEAGN